MIDFPSNPIVGQTFQVGGCIYKCVSINPAVWSATMATGGISDAPVDGKSYGRRNADWEAITKSTVGLGNADNTSDANKPVSTAQAAADNLRVLKTGDTMTGALTVPAIISTAGRLLLQNDTTVDCVNVANSVWVAHRAGTYLAQNGGDAIQAPNGNISTQQMLYAGSPGVRTIGPLNANGRLDCATGMGMYYDGGNANFLMMGAAAGANWSWQWNRSNGVLSWLGGSSQQLVELNPSGAIFSRYNGGGDSFYATGSGGFRTDKGANTAFYAPYGGAVLGTSLDVGTTAYIGGRANADNFFARAVIYNNPGNGYQWSPAYADNGAGGSYCTICFGSPNYGNMAMRYWHQSGQYVGLTMDGENWTRWSLQSGRWIAAGYDLQSDLRGKTNLVKIPSAREKIAALTGYTYDCIDSHNYDGTPYRDVGIVAQELLAVLPEAVKEQLTPTYLNEDGTVDTSRPAVMRYTISPMAIIATLVNDNNELAARISGLETRLAALGG